MLGDVFAIMGLGGSLGNSFGSEVTFFSAVAGRGIFFLTICGELFTTVALITSLFVFSTTGMGELKSKLIMSTDNKITCRTKE